MTHPPPPRQSARRGSLLSVFTLQRGVRLLRRTFLIAFLLVSSGLLTSSTIELIFRYRESVVSIQTLQQEMAQSAAFKIQKYVENLTQTLRTVSQTADLVVNGITDQYRFQLLKLLRVSLAFTTATALDHTGEEVLKVSRLKMIAPDELADHSADEAFVQAQSGASFFGPVYFVRQSEPYMRIAVPIEPSAGVVIGVLMAEVNLKYIWDVISNIRMGQKGYAYVVSPQGDLIAHPDISLVLQKQNLNHLSHVQAALAGTAGPVRRHNLRGEDVFTTVAVIPDLSWAVVFERLTDDAYGPLHASLIRLTLLLLLGLGMAGVASVMIDRRVVRPMEVLRLGAERFGAGDLDHRIHLQTGDELQSLADAFNGMAEQIQASHAELELKVEARTQELARSVADLEIVSQHKSRFLAHMSHELRTPLHAIEGYTQSILSNIYGEIPEKVRESLGRVRYSSKHLLTLITTVLDISRIEAGRFELSIAEYSLLSIVKTVVTSVENLAIAKQLTVHVTAASNLPVGQGDESRLTQVLLNLVGNAITYTERGEIDIEVSASEDIFTMTVTDTGSGIALEDQQRIFEAFEQAHASPERVQSGTGLGLTISKTIIELHGGRIGVNSSLGKGATFWCTFPVRVEF